MYKIEMHPTFCRIIAIFYAFGYWQNDKVLTFGRVAKKIFYLSNMTLFQIIIVGCAWLSDDKIESLFLVQVEILAIVMTVKLIYLFRNKDTILSFLSDLTLTHTISDYELFVKVEKKIRKFVLFVHVYLGIVALVAFVLIISPLPIFFSEKTLPMFIIYSVDWKYSELIYWIIYSPLALQMFLIFVINLLTVIIWYMMLNCSIKYQILGNQLKNLGVPKLTTIELQNMTLPEQEHDPEFQQEFHQELINSVESHHKLVDVITRFISSFSSIFIAQIITSCISICSSNYVFFYSYQNYFLQLVAFILTFFYGIVNIFVVMYLGNLIEFESSQLGYCLYQSNWIDQSKSSRKCVVIMGEVLKKPHELVIFKLFPISNLLTFATIVNFTIALFNVFKKID